MENKNIIPSNDAERIRRNYCCGMIRHMLIYRFSMRELRQIARSQGMQYKKRPNVDRHVDEFTWFEDLIYTQMTTSMRESIVKYERMKYEPVNFINITEEDNSNWNAFERLLYKVVQK